MRRLAKAIDQLKGEHRHRSLKLPNGIDFTSNDYLGLSRHPALTEAATATLARDGFLGATASRLLRGHHSAHADLEAFAAAFFGAEKALYFSTGFAANYALFTTLPDRRDAIVFDALVHASVRDGIRAADARGYKAHHNDADSFRDAARRARANGAQDIWIAVESVYSMDGDLAPLDDLRAVTDEFDAMLIVDEAHGSGIFGRGGRGLTEGTYDARLITLHTGGKAFGAAGGLVCAPAVVIDYLINAARPFIYSTAPPPVVAAAFHRALRLVDEEPWRRTLLATITDHAAKVFSRRLPGAAAPAGSQIIPIILGDADRTVAAAAAAQAAGFDVRAIRPPTVPPGTSRLRLSLSVDRTPGEIDRLADVLSRHLRDLAA